MGGSLLIPYHQSVFGSMDRLAAGDWLQQVAKYNLDKTWWFYLAAVLMILFGLNTLCCFVDWLWQIRSRWRKSGEYLLHLGVLLVLIAYLWGSAAGWRHNGMQFRIGETTPLPNWPGHFLRVDSFKPLMSPHGPPRDMISEVTLLRGDQQLVQGKVQINQPLFFKGVVVTPVSFGRQPVGFRAMLSGIPVTRLERGQKLRLTDGSQLEILRFLPDARRRADGVILYRSNQLGNPAFEMRLSTPRGSSWQGWYFVREALPRELRMRDIRIRLLSPIYDSYSSLTVNYDPGSTLASLGSGLMTIGVLLAFVSFYRKRKHQDRPEI
jgi:cytochrome c biogenesis protein